MALRPRNNPLVAISILLLVLFLITLAFKLMVAQRAPTLPGGGGEFFVKTGTFLDKRYQGVVRQHTDFSCGSAALATLLTYHYESPVEENVVLNTMYAEGDQEKIRRQGFSLLDMKTYLDNAGFHAEGYREPLDKLSKVGIPAIVLINNKGYMHFVVVKGVTQDRIFVSDPALGNKIYARPAFEKIWNGILFVVVDNKDVARHHFVHEDNHEVAHSRFNMPILNEDLAGMTLMTSLTPNYY